MAACNGRLVTWEKWKKKNYAGVFFSRPTENKEEELVLVTAISN
jgi:hypothetical protein